MFPIHMFCIFAQLQLAPSLFSPHTRNINFLMLFKTFSSVAECCSASQCLKLTKLAWEILPVPPPSSSCCLPSSSPTNMMTVAACSSGHTSNHKLQLSLFPKTCWILRSSWEVARLKRWLPKNHPTLVYKSYSCCVVFSPSAIKPTTIMRKS